LGFGDKIRGFFAKRSNPVFPELEHYVETHKGVEGYIEPRTATNPTTLLLVDRHGEHLRGPVRDPEDAAAFCDRLGIPVYDAQVVGYPKRMKDFEKRRRTPDLDDLDASFEELSKRLEATPDDPSGPAEDESS
jgi:hypothetical protein